MKPPFCLFFVYLLLSAPLAVTAATEGPYTYTIDTQQNEATITGFDASYAGSLSITNTLGGCPVTAIGEWAFEACTGLTSVSIPVGVTAIGDGAFDGCESLTEIEFSSSVTEISMWAFYGCSSLATFTVDSGNAIYSSEDGILYDSSKSTLILCPPKKSGSVTIPSGVTVVDEYAFADCAGLTEITIPSSVTTINEGAFAGCQGLTSATIPSNVAFIGERSFVACTKLTAINVDSGNAHYRSLDGVLFDSSNDILMQFPLAKTGSFAIPEGTRAIEDSAFEGCVGLTGITIPVGVTDIGRSAFEGCTGLTTITLPDGVLSIGEWAFEECSGLISATLPNSVTNIGHAVFSQCSGLTAFTIPTGITEIEGNMFFRCFGLTSVTLHENITRIGYAAFEDCARLTTITLPQSVTEIEGSAFLGCTGLASISLPTNLTEIAGFAFYGCTGLASITIPDNVTLIGYRSFKDCSSLTEIMISANLAEIDSEAFYGCSSLTAITVDPENAIYASDSGVLYSKDRTNLIRCPGGKIGSLIIPSIVTDIDYQSIAYCSALTAIVVDPDNAHYSSADGILYTKDLTTLLQCPGGKRGNALIPASVNDIQRRSLTGCAGLTAFVVDPDNTTYYSVDGVVYAVNPSTLVKCPGGKVGSVTLPAGIQEIGREAFTGCAGITDITLSTELQTIDSPVFNGCTSLTALTIDPASEHYATENGILYEKGKRTLIKCPGAKVGSVTIPASVTMINEETFSDCTGLFSVYFRGNSPRAEWNFGFDLADDAILYYQPGTTGWEYPPGYRPTLLYKGPMIRQDAAFGLASDCFGFNITGFADSVVVIEVCTNLSDGVWTPVETNTFNSTGLFYFNDPLSVDYSDCFYRVVLP